MDTNICHALPSDQQHNGKLKQLVANILNHQKMVTKSNDERRK